MMGMPHANALTCSRAADTLSDERVLWTPAVQMEPGRTGVTELDGCKVKLPAT